jgi:hypothetical protein
VLRFALFSFGEAVQRSRPRNEDSTPGIDREAEPKKRQTDTDECLIAVAPLELAEIRELRSDCERHTDRTESGEHPARSCADLPDRRLQRRRGSRVVGH